MICPEPESEAVSTVNTIHTFSAGPILRLRSVYNSPGDANLQNF